LRRFFKILTTDFGRDFGKLVKKIQLIFVDKYSDIATIRLSDRRRNKQHNKQEEKMSRNKNRSKHVFVAQQGAFSLFQTNICLAVWLLSPGAAIKSNLSQKRKKGGASRAVAHFGTD